jgi:hypothetical protein
MHGRRYYSLPEPPALPGLKKPVYFIDFAPGVYHGEVMETAVSARRPLNVDEQAALKKLCAGWFETIDRHYRRVMGRLMAGAEKW